MKTYTHKQGQYLAFIYSYTQIHGRAPAETDLQTYFRTTPPTVHQMILRLEEKGFLQRIPGQARSLKVLLPPDELPPLAQHPDEVNLMTKEYLPKHLPLPDTPTIKSVEISLHIETGNIIYEKFENLENLLNFLLEYQNPAKILERITPKKKQP